MKLNEYQRAVLRSYSEGEYAHLLDFPQIPYPFKLGDKLLEFILDDLGTHTGCSECGHAVSRLVRARNEIQIALDLIAELDNLIAEKTRLSA